MNVNLNTVRVDHFHFIFCFINEAHLKSFSAVLKRTATHPSTLSSNKLVIFSLDTGPAASIVVLLLEVRVIFQLLWCLEQTQTLS